ncbi:hypothetical protein PYV61_24175, partial [Roseisolibacter sp. H3M3-2]|nr:hypothetical protein [Roseisolibacter sp. H3M3-2]
MPSRRTRAAAPRASRSPDRRAPAAAGLLIAASLSPLALRAQAPAASELGGAPTSALQLDTARVQVCVVPGSGTTYRVGAAGLPAKCLKDSHTLLTLNAQGTPGEKGAKGDAGERGATGERGERGERGETGVAGAAGLAGAHGATGAQGPAG